MPESTLLTSKINEKSKENMFNVKANKENIKQTNENDEESVKSKALESRKKATILSEYRKLERKIKERDERYKEKVEKIEEMNKEITKIKEKHTAAIETINKLTIMKDQNDQNKIRNAIEAQRKAEDRATATDLENQKLKKSNNEKQSQIRQWKEQVNKQEETIVDLRNKFDKEYQETITLKKLIDLTNENKKNIQEKSKKDEKAMEEMRLNVAKSEKLLQQEKENSQKLREKIRNLEKELKEIAEEKYKQIDPSYTERRSINQSNATQNALNLMINSSFHPISCNKTTETTNQANTTQDAINLMIESSFHPECEPTKQPNRDTEVNSDISESTLNNLINSSIDLPSTLNTIIQIDDTNTSTETTQSIASENSVEICNFIMKGDYTKNQKEDATINEFHQQIEPTAHENNTKSCLYPEIKILNPVNRAENRKQTTNHITRNQTSKKTSTDGRKRYDRSRSPPKCRRPHKYSRGRSIERTTSRTMRYENHYRTREQPNFRKKDEHQLLS